MVADQYSWRQTDHVVKVVSVWVVSLMVIPCIADLLINPQVAVFMDTQTTSSDPFACPRLLRCSPTARQARFCACANPWRCFFWEGEAETNRLGGFYCFTFCWCSSLLDNKADFRDSWHWGGSTQLQMGLGLCFQGSQEGSPGICEVWRCIRVSSFTLGATFSGHGTEHDKPRLPSKFQTMGGFATSQRQPLDPNFFGTN